MSGFRAAIGGVALLLLSSVGDGSAMARQPAQTPAAGGALECKVMNAMSGDAVVPIKVCRGANGVWHRAEKDLGDQGGLGFKGRIVYSGRFQGSVGRLRTQSLTVNTRGLRFKLDNLGTYVADQRPVTGASTVGINAASGEVTANFDLRGDAASRYVTLRGRAQGGRCELADATGGVHFAGRCDDTMLSGVLKMEDRSGWQFQAAISAPFKSRQSHEQATLDAAAERQRAYQAKVEQQENIRRYAQRLLVQGQGGDPEAMFDLGDLYSSEELGMINLQKAAYWYGKGADHNHPGAMFNLGLAYWNGEGVDKNTARASAFFLQCAKLDSKYRAYCARNIGIAYLSGEGVPESVDKGVYWLKYCSKLGDSNCDQILNRIGKG